VSVVVIWLVVGLGNFGLVYVGNWYNVGVMVFDVLVGWVGGLFKSY